MPVEPNLNKILKEMWRLDEKNQAGEILTEEEQKFYTSNLQTITEYYKNNSEYWSKK